VLGHFLRERVSGGAGGDGEGDAVRRQVTCEALAPGQRLHLTQKKRGVEASKVPRSDLCSATTRSDVKVAVSHDYVYGFDRTWLRDNAKPSSAYV
jgi:hypothetical protein